MLYQFVNIISTMVDVLITVMFFDGLLGWKDISQPKKFLTGAAIFVVTVLNNAFVSSVFLTIAISIVVFAGAAVLSFGGGVRKKIFVIMGYMVLIIAVDMLATFISMRILGADNNTLLSEPSWARIITMLLTKPLMLFFVRMILLFTAKGNAQMYRGCNVMLLVICLINCVLIFAMIRYYEKISMNSINELCLASCCVLCNIVGIFYVFEKIMKLPILENRNSILENQLTLQTNEMKADQTVKQQIQSCRHDVKIHFQTIYALLENKKYDKAKEYLKSTGIVTSAEHQTVHTGNIAFDAIFNDKLNEAEENDIDTVVSCLIPYDIPISDIDIAILFGNLLDNAIEGCMNVKNVKREISVNIKYNKHKLLCSITNSSNPVKKLGGQFISTKISGGNHGIGLQNVERVLRKYEGVCRMEYEDGYFKTNFIMFV